VKKYHIIPTLFWLGLSLFVMTFSLRLGLRGFHNPGPGLAPFVLGLLLLLISLYVLIISLLKKGRGNETPGEGQSRTNYGKIGFVLVALFAYSFLLERLGFLMTTWIFLFLLFRSMGNRWITTLVASTSTVLATYFVFTFFWGQIPSWIFWIRGIRWIFSLVSCPDFKLPFNP
jgi:putative tricarboxylic transport membrane protein